MSMHASHFMEYYVSIRKILLQIDENTTVSDLNGILQITLKGDTDRKTYTDIEWCTGVTTYMPNGFTQMCHAFYSLLFGYIPNSIQIPKLIDIVYAYSRCQSPPNTKNGSLWKHFDMRVPEVKNAIICTNNRFGSTRDFMVFDAKGLSEWCGINDLSLSEVFVGDLYCCALTLDIDGKSIDVKTHGMTISYPIDSVLSELNEQICPIFIKDTKGKWDPRKHPPKYHIWLPEMENEKKLSMRVSIHFPVNVCYENIRELRGCVEALNNAVTDSGRYLIVKHIVVNDQMRFEKSNIDNRWYHMAEMRVSLNEYLAYEIKLHLTTKKATYEIHKIDDMFKINGSIVYCFDGWMASTVDGESFVQCLIDDSIYSVNRSLRLPTQSKLEEGRKVRKFVPYTKSSTILDALIHYPHVDCKPVGSALLLIGNRATQNDVDEVLFTTNDKEVQIINTISAKYGIRVGRAKKIGEQQLCFTVSDGERGKTFCLIKDDLHKSPKMYFVFDERQNILYISCFSATCQMKIRDMGHRKNIPLLKLA